MQRYSRQLSLPDFGPEQQEILARSHVVVVGCGGLGTPAALYLAAAGVGTLTLIDPDHVAETNLHRQVLFLPEDIGKPKTQVLARRLRAQNPNVQVQEQPHAFVQSNARSLIPKQSDILLDGSDNFGTRYLVNDSAVALGLPLVYASVFQYEGQLAVFNAPLPNGGRSGNYRDLFPEPPAPGTVPDCAEGGVLGVAPGTLGVLQASEALKLLTGTGGQPLVNRVWQIDFRSMRTQTLSYQPLPTNPLYQTVVPTERLAPDYQIDCYFTAETPRFLDAETLKQWAENAQNFRLIDVRNPQEREVQHIGGQLVPLSSFATRLPELRPRPSEATVFYCAAGKRSAQALEQFIDAYPAAEAYSLEGGLQRLTAEERDFFRQKSI